MATNVTTTTTSTTTSTQVGTQLVVGSQSNTVTVGNFVTDVSLQPYMSSTIISFYAYNMRPNQLMHVFFDNVNVDAYCAPGIRNASNTYIVNVTNTSDYTQIQPNGIWGTPIYSDNNGFVTAQFAVPAATFKTGSRILEIADVSSLTLGTSSITTMASAEFVASNLSVTKQTVTLTTINPTFTAVPVSNTITTVNVTSTSYTVQPAPAPVSNDQQAEHGFGDSGHADPLAQAFQITTPTGEAGVFATSLQLFFNQTSLTANNGVKIYICDTLNGYPNTNSVLAFSSVHLPMSSINVSNNASVATKFTFESPVFLNNSKLYAFVVKPDNNDPDYQVWVANIGNVDVTTNNQVYSQPVVGGTAFYGATQSEWTALQTEYIKFNLNVAQFTTGSGDAYFNNYPTDYLLVSSLGYTNTSAGMLPGDYIYQATNNTPTTANTLVSGILQLYDPVRGIITVANSTGNFSNNSYIQIHRFANSSLNTPNTTTIIAYANTGNLYNVIVDSLVGQLATITPAGTSLYFEYAGTSNTYVGDTTYNPIQIGYETNLTDKERIVASRSNEVSSLAGNNSMTIHSHLVSESTYLSPVIDLVKNKQLAIRNYLSPVLFDYSEYYNNGYQKSKYISEIVTLAPGQDSQDIQVIITGYRPPGTDIKVYGKFLNSYDSDPISKKSWSLLNNTTNTTFSSPTNPSDFKEYTYTTSNTQPGYLPVIVSTGNLTISNTSNTITGIGTNFTANLQVGWWINMPSNSSFVEAPRQIVYIANATSLQLNSAFNGNYTNQPFYIVAPPTTTYMSTNTLTQVIGIVNTSTTNNSITAYSASVVANTTYINNGTGFITITSANTYLTANQQIYYNVPSGNTAIPGLSGNAFYYVAASNSSGITLSNTQGGSVITLTASSSSTETHNFQSAAFTLQFQPGSIINVANNSEVVVNIANNTYLTVGTPWTTSAVNANVYLQTSSGLTYLNSANGLYSTYIQFQLKAVLQSNSSANVPTMHSLQALALQL